MHQINKLYRACRPERKTETESVVMKIQNQNIRD